jgi:LPS-assembly protein
MLGCAGAALGQSTNSALSVQPPATTVPLPGGAAQDPRNTPATLTADEVTFDRELDIVTATGKVEIIQGPRILRADTVSFSRRADTVTASGNVSILEPSGDVIFADWAELTQDLRSGTMQNFRALLADWSRIAAVSGTRVDGNTTSLRRVTYSPCQACADDPTRPPMWQIKSARTTHDQEKATITHRDAWLEFLGLPILYTPYIEHPDGTQKRVSGFLGPAFGNSNILGNFLAVPYFQTLGNSADVTIEPVFFTKDRPILALEYNQRFAAGTLRLNGSATYGHVYDDRNRQTGRDTFRGHIAGFGRFNIDDDWRWGFDVGRASHDNYLLRYKLFDRFRFIDRNTLVTRPFVEGFHDRSYASVSALSFQGLRIHDDPGQAPLVLPLMEYQWISRSDLRGGYFHFDSYSYAIYRTEGTRSQRTAGIVGYTIPFTASTGEVWTLTTALQGDLFNTSSIGRKHDGFQPSEDGFHGRVHPQVSLGWRWPFVNTTERFRTIIEPVVAVVAGPRIGNQGRLPNEDSRAIDLDDTNLFRRNRFSGLDRLEGGQRVVYGGHINVARVDSPARFSAFLGQSYRFQRDGNFPAESGLDDHESNYVGRVLFSPHPWVSASYRFQLNKNDFSAARTSAGLRLGPEAFNVNFGYSYIERSTQPSLAHDLEQFSTSVTTRLDENWRFTVRESRSLSKDAGQLRFNATLIYEDECFLFGVDFQRRFTGNRDDPPDTSVVLRLTLRNLGDTRIQGY